MKLWKFKGNFYLIEREDMKKNIIVLILILSFVLCGCTARNNETIEIYSKGSTLDDNININLKSGYWVKDFNIDYENNVVTLNLYEEEVSKTEL